MECLSLFSRKLHLSSSFVTRLSELAAAKKPVLGIMGSWLSVQLHLCPSQQLLDSVWLSGVATIAARLLSKFAAKLTFAEVKSPVKRGDQLELSDPLHTRSSSPSQLGFSVSKPGKRAKAVLFVHRTLW